MLAAQWTLAMQLTGVPAKCIAIGTPYSQAMSPILCVSRIPPEVARSGWILPTACFSQRTWKPSFR